LFSLYADVAELADALGSGPSGRKVVEVQVLSSAPEKQHLAVSIWQLAFPGLVSQDFSASLPGHAWDQGIASSLQKKSRFVSGQRFHFAEANHVSYQRIASSLQKRSRFVSGQRFSDAEIWGFDCPFRG
jgi:hypothetical protein